MAAEGEGEVAIETDQKLGRLLEAIASRPGGSGTIPNPDNLESLDLLALTNVLLKRRWIEATAAIGGDGRLVAVKDPSITSVGQRALKDLLRQSRQSDGGSRSMSVQEKQKRRFEYLSRLYEITDGSRTQFVNMWELGDEFGWSREDVDAVAQYLSEEGLLEFMTLGGELGITHRGVLEIERALTHPDEPTEHFLPINIINIETMQNSAIQQGTTDSSLKQTVLENGEQRQELVKLLAQTRSLLTDIPDALDREEAEAELGTAEAQLRSSRPKAAVIGTALARVATILAVAGNSAVGLEHLFHASEQIRALLGI